MALSPNINDLEKAKFQETTDGLTAVRIVSSTPLSPSEYDRIDVTYPTSTQEVYSFSLASNPVGTITVDYVDSTKEQVSSVVRS